MSSSSSVPAIPEPHGLRASNDDRERVARVLQTAMAEGRLTPGELQERLDAVYAAKTLGQLEPVTRDLPGHQMLVPQPASVTPASPTHRLARVGGTPTSTAAIAIMGGSERKGRWVVPRQFNAVAIMGGIELDLTQASFAERETTITVVAIWAGVDVIVSEDLNVIVTGVGVMGAFEDSAKYPGSPDAPMVRINGLSLMGGVEVRRRNKKEQREVEA